MRRFPKKYKVGDILFVEWDDAYTDNNGWTSQTKLQEANSCRCYSIGRYSGQNKDGDVLLAGSWDTGTPHICLNNVSGRPEAMIRKVALIRKGKTGK